MSKGRGATTMVWRYWTLSGLFGSVYGIRFTLDVWTFRQFNEGWITAFMFIAITMSGMLFGEMLSGIVSDRVGRQFALNVSICSIVCWAIAAIFAIYTSEISLFICGSFVFGLGFGIFHSSLDAWFAEELSCRLEIEVLELRLTQGYMVYNFGYFIGAGFAFPLLLNFHWNMNMLSPMDVASLHFWPYLVALVAVAAIARLVVPSSINARTSRTVLHVVGSRTLMKLLRDYTLILSRGKLRLLSIVLVAGSIALVIQLFDHLAPAGLLPGSLLWERAVNIFVFNFIVCAGVGVLQVLLNKFSNGIHMPFLVRRKIIKLTLASVVSLLIFCSFYSIKYPGYGMVVSGALGIVQAALLTLPPLLKAWVLEFNVSERYATTLAILGVGKRLFAIFGVMLFPLASQFSDQPVALYELATGVAIVALALLTFSTPREPNGRQRLVT
jgi:MFS family permease